MGGRGSKSGEPKKPKKNGEALGLIVYNPDAVKETESVHTREEVEELANKNGLKVTKEVFDKIPPDLLYDSLSGVVGMYAEYGVSPQDTIGGIQLRSGSGAYGSSQKGQYGMISLYDGWYTNPTAFQKSYESDAKSHWHPQGDSSDVAVHEAAHRLEWMLGNKAWNTEAYPSGKKVPNDWSAMFGNLHGNYATKDIVETAIRNIKKTPYGKGKSNSELRRGISRYSDFHNDGRRWSETFAEAITDDYRNGSNANPLSKEIAKLTKAYLKGWKKVG